MKKGDAVQSIGGALITGVCAIGAAVFSGVVLAVLAFTAYGAFRWLCGLWGI